jgi:tetraacyldisaccharide 4'-kinase
MIRPILIPLSWVYGLVIFLRNLAYDRGVFRIQRLTVPVISIGNLSAGGTGKTPVTMALARLLKDTPYHHRAAVLSRGYKRSSQGYQLVSAGKGPLCSWTEAGDEPYLLARNLPGVPVAVDANRFHGGVELIRRLKPDVILLDDGFQHRRLHRDLDLVLVDVESGIEEKLLPAGMLREPLSSLQRANLILLTHFQPDAPVSQMAWEYCSRRYGENRLAACRVRPSGLLELRSGKTAPLSALKGMRALPFCGIAKPEGFLQILETAGVEFPFLIRLPDHHHYNPRDVERLAEAFAKTRASSLITTEKDAVKLEGLFAALPILVLQIEIEWLRGLENLERELSKLFV